MSIDTEEKRIKFPDQHYVGFQKRKEDVNLGFMTPYGTDSQAKKRIKTVDNWAKSNRRYDYAARAYIEEDRIPAVVLNNAPVKGFKLSNSVNHSSSWANCRDKWRIEDPRGFELEITSGNLEKILEFTDIIKGEIQESCIWARLGAENILIPVNTDLYKNAKNNTTRYNKKVSTRDLKPGYKATLQNGKEGIYMGFFYVVSAVINSYHYRHDNPSDQRYASLDVSNKKRHIFKSLDNEYRFFGYATPKVSEIEELDIIETPEQVINEILRDNDNKFKASLRTHTEHFCVGVTSIKADYTTRFTHNRDSSEAVTDGHSYGFVDYDSLHYSGFSIKNDSYYRDQRGLISRIVKKDPSLECANIMVQKRDYWNPHQWNTSSHFIPNVPEKITTVTLEFATSYGKEEYRV